MYVFKEEEKTYMVEGLERYLSQLTFTDNKPIIDVLEKPPVGIFCILDDSSAVAGTDESFLTKVK
jgi:myosin heavy subunit